MSQTNRRTFLRYVASIGAVTPLAGPSLAFLSAPSTGLLAAREAIGQVTGRKGERMTYGLVTYLWGQNWTLDELIGNCEKAGVHGVELRTTHKHGVEPTLDERQRAEVAKKFANSRVKLVGIGSNERFDHAEPTALRKAIDDTKAFVRLSRDVGGTGVKVKPDGFPPGVTRGKTIEQIGRALNEVGAYAQTFGQQIRLEVHGQCAELPTIKAILDVADHANVTVCWNSNAQDLKGEGLRHNFGLVAKRLGATCHVRELESPDYPFQELINLLVEIDYGGCVMLEASSKPADPIAAMAAQVARFAAMVEKART